MKKLSETLLPPELPINLPPNAKWLSGEGAGSWFVIESADKNQTFEISRYSPDGQLECEGIFYAQNKFDIQKDYQLTYPSFCNKVSLIQNDKTINFVPVE